MEGYNYEIWFDGNCIHSENGFDTEDEAREEAEYMIQGYIDEWFYSESEPCNENDFEIIIK